MPSSQWKMRTQRQKWYAGETISVSIGQGALTVTPLQLARAFAGLVVGGTWRRPHLTRDGGANDKPVQWPLDPKNVKDVVSGMYGVVNEGGTGVRAAIPGLAVCGKTGTAQVASNDFVKAHGHEGQDLKDNVWFVGFAPCEKPEIVVTAFFEHGFESKYACPIVRDVIKAYFDKKARNAMLQQQRNALAINLSSVCSLGTHTTSLAAPKLRSDLNPAPDSRRPLAMSRYLSIRDLDWTMILIALIICVVGVMQIFSATLDTSSQGAWWKQAVYIVGGLLLMWIALSVDYHSMLHWVPMLYLGSLGGLLLTLVFGETTMGGQRWIPLPGGFHFQISEFVKLVIILLVARYLTDLHKDDLDVRDALKLAPP